MEPQIVIKARNIEKNYADGSALAGFDLDVYQGQIMGLVGPNGAGIDFFTGRFRPGRY